MKMMSTPYLIVTKVSLADQVRDVEQAIATERAGPALEAALISLQNLQNLRNFILNGDDPDPDKVADLVLACLGNPEQAATTAEDPAGE